MYAGVDAEMAEPLLRKARLVDMWREARRRWMVGGVLAALLAAVLCPALGAPGGFRVHCPGPLHTQYLRFVPLSYIYYRAGAGAGAAGGTSARVLAASCAHGALVPPALAALVLAAAPQHYRLLLHGVVEAGAGGGCAWLALAMSAHPAAGRLAALSYLAGLLAAPAAGLLLCGRAVVPPLSSVAGTLAAALPPYLAGAGVRRLRGAVAPGPRRERDAARACACALLYVQCCEGLASRGGGALPPAHLLAALLLEAGWVALSAAACWAHARCGPLPAADARLLAACALPRSAHPGWVCGAGASAARLPPVFLAPAQALLLAALLPDA